MIIDLILDRKCGSSYSPKEFRRRVAEYGETWPEMAAPILEAMDNGTDGTIKAALCQYVIGNEYNPEICDYICSVSWQDKAEAAHPFRVGDILYSSWGYDQTNITLYRVMALNGKTMITLQECVLPIKTRDAYSSMSQDVSFRIPAPDEPVKLVGKPMKRKVKQEYRGTRYEVDISGHETAREYAGQTLYQSWYA